MGRLQLVRVAIGLIRGKEKELPPMLPVSDHQGPDGT